MIRTLTRAQTAHVRGLRWHCARERTVPCRPFLAVRLLFQRHVTSQRNVAGFPAVLVAALLTPALAGAQTPDLSRASIEDLLNIEITSASRREQRAADTAAAVFVITQDDIRRSGATTVPELLRLVPGLQVAQINSNTWAISARGFNDLWANQLLVLIDGRTVYTRTYSGVPWSMQDLILDDIERIEIVRGPGSSIWGANAVNGVINIITKSADDTRGTLVRVGGGSFDRSQAAVRFGASAGAARYRLFSQWSDHDASVQGVNRTSAGDSWHHVTAGGRVDWTGDADTVMAQSTAILGAQYPLWTPVNGPSAALSAGVYERGSSHDRSALGRWTHTFSPGLSLQVQSFFDDAERVDGNGVAQHESTGDVDFEMRAHAGRHDLVAGGGYRDYDARVTNNFIYSVTPDVWETSVFNAFAQDDVAVTHDLHVIAGSKFERDELSGWNIQPTARVIRLFDNHQQRIWAAVSRALRTPSLNDLAMHVNYAALPGGAGLPIVLGIVGNANYKPEQLVDVEAGYRIQLTASASLDVTAFRGKYVGLATNEPMAPVVEATPVPHLFIGTQYENWLNADTQGLEVAGTIMPARAWRIDASYSGLKIVPHIAPMSSDTTTAATSGSAPSNQWQVRSTVRLAPRSSMNVALFHVGALRDRDVPAYTRADARVEFQLNSRLTIAAVGQNLLTPSHAEFTTDELRATEIPRNVSLNVVWHTK